MNLRFEKSISAEASVDVPAPSGTFAIEFYSAAPATYEILTASGELLLSHDDETHLHCFFIRGGNRYLFVTNRDIQTAPDVAVSEFPLTIMSSGLAVVRLYDD